MIEVSKAIYIKGHYDMEYAVKLESNTISVYARDFDDEYDCDQPLIVLNKEESKALSRALSELASGY